MIKDPWSREFRLNTPAGMVLERLAHALPEQRHFQITVFGSAPLQICIDAGLLSGDVDIFTDSEDVDTWVRAAGLDEEQNRPYIQIGSGLNFRTSPLWGTRTQSIRLRNATFIFPHPIDILIAKLNRLDEKDLEAFEVVRRKTGHPTEAEMISELQLAVDLFRPGFDEENSADLMVNTHRLWPLIFGREIDARREIIQPALAKRRAGYGLPARDYKRELQE